jgi:phage portal protein BeeE
MQTFGNALYQNGTNPSGVLEVPHTLTPEAMRRLRESLAQIQSGASNTGRFLVLDGDMKWKQLSINPDDAEFLASVRFRTTGHGSGGSGTCAIFLCFHRESSWRNLEIKRSNHIIS